MDKDPKALSGGEKSFATICLLLSLWEAIGCPIRCLDEFDVFMDAVNRKVSMKMIVRSRSHTRLMQRARLWACSTSSSRRKTWRMYRCARAYSMLTTAMYKFIGCKTLSGVLVPNYMLGPCHDPVVR